MLMLLGWSVYIPIECQLRILRLEAKPSLVLIELPRLVRTLSLPSPPLSVSRQSISFSCLDDHFLTVKQELQSHCRHVFKSSWRRRPLRASSDG
jgi:hypothetical protein